MIKVGRKSIIEHQLDAIPPELVERLVIITGHKADVLTEFVKSLDLPYPVTFYRNEQYANTHCTCSLLMAYREMSRGFVYINADLLFTCENLIALLESEHSDAICARRIGNYRTDLQQIRTEGEKIIEWKLHTDLPNDGEVMGPLKISAPSAQLILEYCQTIPGDRRRRLSCFTMFSLLLGKVDYHAVFLKNDNWCEIDTPEDLDKATQMWIAK